MGQKRNSKSKSSGNKTQQNNNYAGYSNEPKTHPSKSKSHGAKEQSHYPGNSTAQNSNQIAWGLSRNSSVSDMWSDADEHFPVLGAISSEPKVNVWEERKSKQEAIKAMEPESPYDEEAMLQHALALSLFEATEEEERRKKMEEDYKIQLEALQCFPEDVEDFDEPNDYLRNSASNSSQNETIYNSKDSKYEDEFLEKSMSSSTSSSKNSMSNCNQKEKPYNSAGARPKINKAIEAFGGWGLKDDKKKNNADKISEFVDDVMNDKPSKSDYYNKISNDKRNKCKENYNSSKDNVSHSTDTKNVTKSATIESFDDKGDILYNEKGTFLNDDEDSWLNCDIVNQTCVSPKKSAKTEKSDDKSDILNDEKKACLDNDSWLNCDIVNLTCVSSKNSKKSATTQKTNNKSDILNDEKGACLDNNDDSWYNCSVVNQTCVSPNKKLDTWLNSEDVNDWNNKVLNESNVPTPNEDLIHAPSFRETSKMIDNEDKSLSSPTEFPIPTITSDYECKVTNSESLFQETSESSKNIWSNATNFEEQRPSESKNVHNYTACDSSMNSFTPFHEPTEVPTLTSSKMWPEKSSNNSPYFSSFPDNNLSSKLESVKLGENVDNEVFNATSLSNDSDMPPIPPPQTPPPDPSINEYTASTTNNNNPSMESPIIPHPQPVPEMTGPQPPTFGNPILNPMFLGLNPMMGYGMDPLLMRRMLILSNPFLANQLFAMEQYYRSLGMPVDLFSMPSSMPNASEFMNPNFLQNTVINNVNINMQQLECQIQQLQTQIDANASANGNPIESLEQKSYEPSEINAVNNCNDTSDSVKTCDGDPWYKSYLPNDSTVIPPPMPPSNEVNTYNLMSVSQNSESSQNVSNNENKFAHSHVSNNSTGHLPSINKEIPPRAFDASTTKTQIPGWGDFEDFPDAHSFKSKTWNDDDGWGDEIPPPKPARHLSIHDDKKKAVFRQPAKQPQISRCQRNFT